jgi:nitroreductase
VAVCANEALSHDKLPALKPLSRELLSEIRPDNLSAYFRSRRSIRAFQSRKVDRAVLEQLFDTLSYAPTGVNQQQNKWVVVCDAAQIARVSDAVIDWMRGMVAAQSELANYLGFSNLVRLYESGQDVICRKAPCLVIGYTDAAYTGGAIDSVIATAHLELLLPAHQLGGCWAGFVMIALGYSPEVRSLLGINETHAVRSALMLGHPTYTYHKEPFRREPSIVWL